MVPSSVFADGGNNGQDSALSMPQFPLCVARSLHLALKLVNNVSVLAAVPL